MLKGHSTSKKKAYNINKYDPRQAFETIRSKLAQPPVLAYADPDLPYTLHTDASGDGLDKGVLIE